MTAMLQLAVLSGSTAMIGAAGLAGWLYAAWASRGDHARGRVVLLTGRWADPRVARLEALERARHLGRGRA